MRVKKTEKVIKEVEIVVEDKNLCDKCNQNVNNGVGECEDFEFKLEYKLGESYAADWGVIDTMELCKNCVDDCMTLLRDNGYRIIESEYDN